MTPRISMHACAPMTHASIEGERRGQAREQIRMRDELHYARELQPSMLPECAPDLPKSVRRTLNDL